MKLLRNPEIKKGLIILSALAVISSSLCFFINVKCGFISLFFFTAVIILYIYDAKKRYAAMAVLTNEIDLILHGDENLVLSRYSEGELSILQSEISKLIIRLREQADMLKGEKVRLADSIADISHQIRTPLTSINLILESANDQNLSQKQRILKLFEIQKLLSRIDWLISTLLKIAKLDAGTVKFKKEQTELSKLIALSASPLAIPMEIKNQEITSNISGKFYGDLSWTAEAVGNIIKNCTEHMESGKLYITAAENPIYSEIIIRDTGKGFDKDDLPHIFERFYKGKNSGDNSVGIGLALARMIITGQNGTVKAENHRDGGAVFTIRFYKGTV